MNSPPGNQLKQPQYELWQIPKEITWSLLMITSVGKLLNDFTNPSDNFLRRGKTSQGGFWKLIKYLPQILYLFWNAIIGWLIVQIKNSYYLVGHNNELQFLIAGLRRAPGEDVVPPARPPVPCVEGPSHPNGQEARGGRGGPSARRRGGGGDGREVWLRDRGAGARCRGGIGGENILERSRVKIIESGLLCIVLNQSENTYLWKMNKILNLKKINQILIGNT